MAISLRPRRRSKLERVKQAVSALAALRAARSLLSPRRLVMAAGAAALSVAAMAIAKRRSSQHEGAVPGAPPTEAAAPAPAQNGASAAHDAPTEAHDAAASVTPRHAA